MGRRKRDLYGNWVDEDAEKEENRAIDSNLESQRSSDLEWKDWFALIIAFLQTVAVPLIIFVVILIVLAALLLH